jgi:colanic acid/amylovoran biosynthesis glycosyltransferase
MQPNNNRTIGYFIPEFPGQTHIFFWRELKELRALELKPEIVSTHRPPQHLVSHTWSEAAARETTYLFPPGLKLLGTALGEIFLAGPRAWLRCVKCIAEADVSGLAARLRLAGLVLIGAELAVTARQRGWQHVHVHSCANAANIALFAHLLSGLSYSLTLHGGLHDYGLNQRNKWRHAAFGIVITRTLKAELEKSLNSALPERIAIAPMGVDLSVLKRSRPYEPWGGIGPCSIFSCGRLNPCKGHDDAVRAVALLRQQGIDARLTIAGQDDTQGGSYRKMLDGLIAELELEGCVKLLGAVSEETVRQHLENSHAFVLASLQEPLGVAIMEAMAMGVPVVATREGGVPELIEHDTDGLLVDARAPEQLAAALLRVMRDQELAQRLSRAGWRTVAERFHSGVSARVLADGVSACSGVKM